VGSYAVQTVWYLKMEPMNFPETTVTSYQPTLGKIPKSNISFTPRDKPHIKSEWPDAKFQFLWIVISAAICISKSHRTPVRFDSLFVSQFLRQTLFLLGWRRENLLRFGLWRQDGSLCRPTLGCEKDRSLRTFYPIFFLRIGWRSPSRCINGRTAWSMSRTHILDLTNSTQWVTRTYRTVESDIERFPFVINRLVLVPVRGFFMIRLAK
jgi:hypothetical protein